MALLTAFVIIPIPVDQTKSHLNNNPATCPAWLTAMRRLDADAALIAPLSYDRTKKSCTRWPNVCLLAGAMSSSRSTTPSATSSTTCPPPRARHRAGRTVRTPAIRWVRGWGEVRAGATQHLASCPYVVVSLISISGSLRPCHTPPDAAPVPLPALPLRHHTALVLPFPARTVGWLRPVWRMLHRDGQQGLCRSRVRG